MAGLPANTPPSDYAKISVALLAYLEENLEPQNLYDLVVIAETPDEFVHGMDALVRLAEIVEYHNELTEYHQNKEPDDDSYQEEIDSQWGTEGDDFDPPEDWFGPDGPLGPLDSGLL